MSIPRQIPLTSVPFALTVTSRPVNMQYARHWSSKFLTSVEMELRESEGSPYRIGAGLEWWVFARRLALRGGWRYVRTGFDDISLPSFGAAGRAGPLVVEYAFRMEPDLLGDTHRLGILVDF